MSSAKQRIWSGEMEEYVTIRIKYGIGYGSHETDCEVPKDATDEEIHDIVYDMISERLDFSWEREE